MRRFLAWWRQASPAWCWGLPLAVLAAVLALDWLRLHAEGVATPAEARHLLLRVGLVAGAAGIVMAMPKPTAMSGATRIT